MTLYHNTDACQAVLKHAEGNLILLEHMGKRPIMDDWVSGQSNIDGDGGAYIDLGYNLGFRIPATQLIIDVDPRNGGWDDYAQLPQDVRELPATTITAGGGIHIYTMLPEGFDYKTLRSSLKKDRGWAGLDFLHYGKQVVLPGSMINETTGWRVGPDAIFPPPLTPQSLLDILERQAPEAQVVDLESYLSLFELDTILAMIPVNRYQDNDSWLKLSMACHHATNGDGLPAFLAWSISDPMYCDQGEIISKRWDSMDAGNTPVPVTIRTLVKELSSHGPVPSWLLARADMKTSPKDFFGAIDEKLDPIKETFEQLGQQIDVSDNHIWLLTTMAAKIGMESQLTESVRELLLKKISTKTGASVASIRKDIKMMSTPRFQALDGEDPEVPEDVTEVSQPHTAAAQTAIAALSAADGIPLAYCLGSWLKWNGQCWERVGTEVEVKREAHKALYNQGTHATDSAVKSVVGIMQTLMEVPSQAFEPNTETIVIHTPFSTIRYHKDGWKISQPSPENRNLTFISAPYKPDAPVPDIWFKFLNEVTTSETAQRTIACTIIYAASGCRPWLRKAIYLYGPKRSGKSTMLNLIQFLLGSKNCSALNMRQLGSKHGGSSLIGKLANISNETVSKDTIQDDVFKTLISGEALEVEPKFKQSFVYHNTAKLIFAANGFPRVDDESDATLDRLTIISCPYSILAEVSDPMLIEKLKQEISGVLNWAMQIFREEYQKDTCISAMSMDADAKHVMSQWKEINNPALRWLKERTAKTSSRSLILDEAYVDYRNWCRDNGHKELNKIHFSRQIARNVKRIRDTGDVSTFLGISLKPIESRHFNVLN